MRNEYWQHKRHIWNYRHTNKEELHQKNRCLWTVNRCIRIKGEVSREFTRAARNLTFVSDASPNIVDAALCTYGHYNVYEMGCHSAMYIDISDINCYVGLYLPQIHRFYVITYYEYVHHDCVKNTSRSIPLFRIPSWWWSELEACCSA